MKERHAQREVALRLRRSVVFMPGSNCRALQSARTLATDAIILDLEFEFRTLRNAAACLAR